MLIKMSTCFMAKNCKVCCRFLCVCASTHVSSHRTWPGSLYLTLRIRFPFATQHRRLAYFARDTHTDRSLRRWSVEMKLWSVVEMKPFGYLGRMLGDSGCGSSRSNATPWWLPYVRGKAHVFTMNCECGIAVDGLKRGIHPSASQLANGGYV